MGLEKDHVEVDPDDDAWKEWSWRNRYRVWEAARQVFLYPENWLVESQRPDRTEIFRDLERAVHQNEGTRDYLETVVLDYVTRLDELAHVLVTGTWSDTRTHVHHVVGRIPEDPPRFYHRLLSNGAWTGWERIPFDIRAQQAVPAVYRGRVCVFWLDIQVANEPRQQNLPAPGDLAASHSPPQNASKYVKIGLNFTIFRNGSWAPPQKSRGMLFDVPYELLSSDQRTDSLSVESLYTIKVLSRDSATSDYGPSLQIDVFRQGAFEVFFGLFLGSDDPTKAVHIGRATFDGRFNDLELSDQISIVVNGSIDALLPHAQEARYGPYVDELQPLSDPEPDLGFEGLLWGLHPRAGALVKDLGEEPATLQFGPELLHEAPSFRIVISDTELILNPVLPFFFQDAARCYFVQLIFSENSWLFSRFYHRYTRLFSHQLSSGGFPALFKPLLQRRPNSDSIEPPPHFSFMDTYGADGDLVASRDEPSVTEDDEVDDSKGVQFARDAAYSAYNWELFYHVPLYIAELLSQNQKFEDALAWFRFIFDPTRQEPGRALRSSCWIPRPLHALASDPNNIYQQRINNLLQLVHQPDQAAVDQVSSWQIDPFNPFRLADLRQVAYMKRAVMSYLDNLIAWADYLFSSDSREALNEATLLYVIAAEILGPEPAAVTPPRHPDRSFQDLKPDLDAFANAMVEIENSVQAGGGGVGGAGGDGGGMPRPLTFYFKIPPNEKLLGYWKTVADRLFKLRHCQNIQGVTRELALFDAPIDPGLLVRARAAGIDIGSVLNNSQAPLPGYRFAAMYPQALEFCQAVRDYGAELLATLEKSDAAALALLLATHRKQLHDEAEQILESRVEEANKQIEALNQAKTLAKAKLERAQSWPVPNTAEVVALGCLGTAALVATVAGIVKGTAAVEAAAPTLSEGIAGWGGTPYMVLNENYIEPVDKSAEAAEVSVKVLELGAEISKVTAEFLERAEEYEAKAEEAEIEIERTTAEIDAANLRASITSDELDNHRAQAERLQQQIDFLTSRFTSQELYDWMVGRLSDTYFQSYRLAYRLCKQVERCYNYELGPSNSSTSDAFIRFGQWDSLKKGLLAGESLCLDVRRMQASYVERNARRFEITRHVSLSNRPALHVNKSTLDPATTALEALKSAGQCHFELDEELFDGDYPGHYQRRLQRVGVTVVYPDASQFDNIRGTLTLKENKVRKSTDRGSGYPEAPGDNDSRFIYQYAAVPRKIVLSHGRDDSGMFIGDMSENLRDPRYLPFEGAGAISFWQLALPRGRNDIDITQITDVVLHVSYTALDGGAGFGPTS
jgi:hypothetical protein